MKRMVAIFLLCAVLLTSGAATREDPLVTQSYVTDTFVPDMRRAFSALSDSALWGGVQTPERILNLTAGSAVALTQGQQFSLLRGAAQLRMQNGEVVDASIGAVAENGPVRLYTRYIACEDARAWVEITEDASLKVSYGAAVDLGSPFLDVNRDDWFYTDVVTAAGWGLINGMTETEFAPQNELSIAQCVKLAACMHQLWNTGRVTLQNSTSGPWYRSYVDYALANRVLTAEFMNYDAPAQRDIFVGIFSSALPESAYAQINSVPDGAIPDLDDSTYYRSEIYTFYRAGILTGYPASDEHQAYDFAPKSTISRAEAAVIINRMFTEGARVHFAIS